MFDKVTYSPSTTNWPDTTLRVLAYDVLTEENDRLLTGCRYPDGTADISQCRGPSFHYAKSLMEKLGLTHRDFMEFRARRSCSYEQDLETLTTISPDWRKWVE